LFERLKLELPADVEHVFVNQPGFFRAPHGASTALRSTRRYHELLRTSPLIIANCELHQTFTRAGFQTVVQTWHGTPLKRIGLDIDDPKFANTEYQANLAHQVAQWSMMISPTEDTDEIFPRAFGYDGPLLRTGSPRNDRLVRNDARERETIRHRIGVSHDAVAILFAPTFRDDDRSEAGYQTSPQCDLATLLTALPDNVVVLFRAHSNIRSSDIPWQDPRVINVSDFPDAQDLILAGDILVTDYSSMMFDWALTHKPIVAFASDLERYQSVRDFYYDYREVVPQTPATTPADLGAAVAQAIDTRQADNSALIERFADRDDGAATDRVVEETLRRVDF
jgi:CDP-glycerol glycerophosphotransferase